MTIQFDHTLLPPRSFKASINSRSITGGPAMSGFNVVVQSDAGFWTVSYGKIFLKTPAQIRAWRSMAAQLEGMINPILVPILGIHPSITGATVNANAALRATSIVINTSGTITPGDFFSIGDRLYVVSAVSRISNLHTCTIRPPLREAVSAGAAVEFILPVLRCKLASDREMDLDTDLFRFAEISIEFVEDL